MDTERFLPKQVEADYDDLGAEEKPTHSTMLIQWPFHCLGETLMTIAFVCLFIHFIVFYSSCLLFVQ